MFPPSSLVTLSLCHPYFLARAVLNIFPHASFLPPSKPLQNKIDLVTEAAATNQQEDIQKFIQGTVADGAPIVPVSAQLKYNVDVVCEYIMRKVPVPVRCVGVCVCGGKRAVLAKGQLG